MQAKHEVHNKLAFIKYQIARFPRTETFTMCNAGLFIYLLIKLVAITRLPIWLQFWIGYMTVETTYIHIYIYIRPGCMKYKLSNPNVLFSKHFWYSAGIRDFLFSKYMNKGYARGSGTRRFLCKDNSVFWVLYEMFWSTK